MKILIVDDEKGVHDHLRSAVPWTTLGWEIVGDAYDGEQACRLAQACQPDIILTDIKMPLMDGLMFMEWLKAGHFRGKVIVLSGYGDFEYSRSAFLLDGFDYLLKPVNEAQLLGVLSKAAEELEKESRTIIDQIDQRAVLNKGIVLMQDEFLTNIISGAIRDENEMFVGVESLPVSLPEGKFTVVVVQIVDSEIKVQMTYGGNRNVFYFAVRNILQECLGQQDGVVFRNLTKKHEFILLFPDESRNAERSQWLVKSIHAGFSSFLRVNARYGISSVKQRLKAIPDAYLEAYQSVEGLPLDNGPRWAQYVSGKPPAAAAMPDVWGEFQRLLESLLETGTLPANVNLLQKLDQALSDEVLGKMSGTMVKQAVLSLLVAIEKGFRKPLDSLIVSMHQVRSELNDWNLQEAGRLLREVVRDVIEEWTGDTTMKNGRQIIEIVKKHVFEHYRNVSLEEISQRFYLNKNYLCSLFKSATGENFTEFVTRVRMERAKWLLTHTDRKTYEIAGLVGYSDQRYFSKVFKKHTGKQPTEFRIDNQEEGIS
ncbi:helix-turn-helix domain-containing protein [Cohnella caldifontis]|uniref:helix-turn-helix domain-containing protein n=1 Tax=Cohnella caldifontis TaxID=3027471 RepID=UPI0023ECC253|nr:helix-turn-helix domain-containing protein [Cohnella sp. YIM B05605]